MLQQCFNLILSIHFQVAATTNHHVTLVDQTDDILGNAIKSIEKSLQRVVKKKFKDDKEVTVTCTCSRLLMHA